MLQMKAEEYILNQRQSFNLGYTSIYILGEGKSVLTVAILMSAARGWHICFSLEKTFMSPIYSAVAETNTLN